MVPHVYPFHRYKNVSHTKSKKFSSIKVGTRGLSIANPFGTQELTQKHRHTRTGWIHSSVNFTRATIICDGVLPP